MYSGFKVTYEGKSTIGLFYDEMIGLISVITAEKGMGCLLWLKPNSIKRKISIWSPDNNRDPKYLEIKNSRYVIVRAYKK